MTLLRQLALSFTILLFLLFSISLIMNVRDARNYLQAELESHAQNTATALGVAIASTDANDIATADSIIDAVFDRGQYRIIRYSDLSGNVLINSEQSAKISGVPEWFFSLVNFTAKGVSTEVNRGWVPAGILYVESHPAYAYQNIWAKTRNESILFTFGLLLAIIGLHILLNIVLRPLKRLEKQADAICNRRFEVQEKLPKTKDLRQVVEAMNRMARKLQTLFNEKVILTEELRSQSLKDSVTDILNNRAFENQVTSILNDERGEAGGTLLLIHIDGIETLQRSEGDQAMDNFLIDVTSRLHQTTELWPNITIGRKNISLFAILLPTSNMEESKRFAEGCFRALASLPFFISEAGEEKLHLASVTHMGKCQYPTLLKHTEDVMKELQMQAHNCWGAQEIGDKKEHNYLTWSQAHWQETLQDVFSNEQIELLVQQVFDKDDKPIFVEIFSRLKLDNEIASAQAFLPMVDRFDLHTEFDKAVVNTLIRRMETIRTEQTYCINISPRSLLDDDFSQWLLQLLQTNPAISKRLIIETPERILHQSGELLTKRVSALTATGCLFSLDHFGITTQSLTTLDSLDISYIKVDSSFVKDITENQGNQFYIRTLAMLTSSRDITLLAHGIEKESELTKLVHLGVKGGQGYYLAKPEKF